MSKYESLLITKEGRVAILTLNRPEQLNTVGPAVWQELEMAANEIEAMDDLGAVIITGAGKHFTAGIDLSTLEDFNSSFVMKNIPWAQSVYTRWEVFPVPVIAAIRGVCYGSGVELILACDIRIAADNLRISIPEVRFGLAPDMGGTTRLPKLIGPGQAKRLIYSCDEINAEEAARIGLVELVVSKDKLMEEAMALANRIAAQPPIAVKMAKRGINAAMDSSVAAGLLFEQAQTTYCCGTEDQNEAIKAFFEKREPVFKER